MPRPTAILLAVLLFSGAMLGWSPVAEAQCAMCRTALEGSEQGRVVAKKLNRGILFLIGAPFAVAAGIGVALTRSHRRLGDL